MARGGKTSAGLEGRLYSLSVIAWADFRLGISASDPASDDSAVRNAGLNMRVHQTQMAGEPLRELNWDHPFSPPEILHEELVNSQAEVTVDLQTEKKHNQRSSPSWHRLDRQPKRPTDAPLGQKAVSGDSPLVGRDDDTRHEGNGTGFHGHYCHVPGVDLMIVQVFNYGLDQSGFWTFRVSDILVEKRLGH
uniref:Uncharacterized protein n=1 Tax=Kwoniella dejecticola CBS 10117 TaxID=1296121 RepID=A0A1A5ZV04_9TREE|nr:uncharacterized protein I303_08413 [Kwoniella dejecticola CBS 10117]OBR81642.1 hypothetical protein I303_08413 [Kwoniella dejecticola CBS 10117]